MKGTYLIENGMLKPADDDALSILARMEGQFIVLDIKKQRNPYFHRYGFSMLKNLYDMIDDDHSFNPWRKNLTVKAGHFISHGKVLVNGEVVASVEALSLAFENMDDLEFREVWNDLINAFIQKYGRAITYNELSRAASM